MKKRIAYTIAGVVIGLLVPLVLGSIVAVGAGIGGAGDDYGFILLMTAIFSAVTLGPAFLVLLWVDLWSAVLFVAAVAGAFYYFNDNSFIWLFLVLLLPALLAVEFIFRRGLAWMSRSAADPPLYSRRGFQIVTVLAVVGSASLAYVTRVPPLTPTLHQAAGGRDQSLSTVRKEIAAGADVNARDPGSPWGETPLHTASGSSSGSSLEIVEALIEAGAEVTIRDEHGETPLHYAAGRNPSAAVIHLLVKAGADVNARDRLGRTPLHKAAFSNASSEVLRALIDEGADADARWTETGETPLHRVFSSAGSTPKMNALIEAGSDVNARDNLGNTPLHKAAMYAKSAGPIKALIAAGAEVGAKNSNGETALLVALYEDAPQAVVDALTATLD